MELFYTIIIGIAIVLLIVVLTTFGIMIQYSSTGGVYPTIQNTCPDYWNVDTSANCYISKSASINTGGSGSDTLTSTQTYISGAVNTNYTPGLLTDSSNIRINFSDPKWSATPFNNFSDIKCAYKSWANSNSIQWDGITDYNNC
jgi:hypothetical protein